jgi:hypothetical protein
MSEMKSLHQIIIEKGSEYDWQRIDPIHLVGTVDGSPRKIRAILDRTAIVNPLNDASPEARSVVPFHRIMVWPQDIKWEQRPFVDIPPRAFDTSGGA